MGKSWQQEEREKKGKKKVHKKGEKTKSKTTKTRICKHTLRNGGIDLDHLFIQT